jgi:hypothetical protein
MARKKNKRPFVCTIIDGIYREQLRQLSCITHATHM